MKSKCKYCGIELYQYGQEKCGGSSCVSYYIKRKKEAIEAYKKKIRG